LSLSDVMLDTLYWSGGNTSLDAFACGVPVVTLPGELMRSRQTAAMLNIMDLGELIANDVDDYVNLAIKVAGDASFNESLRSRINNNRTRLFNQQAPIMALAENLIKIAQ
jgi:predicted O-linked N-acetylglucosamine transferase (SPINDLY family)